MLGPCDFDFGSQQMKICIERTAVSPNKQLSLGRTRTGTMRAGEPLERIAPLD